MSSLWAWLLALPLEGGLFAGWQVVEGEREIPVLGTVRPRNETRFLARFERTPEGLVMRQRTCGVEMAPVLGVQVRLPDRLLARLPVQSGLLRGERVLTGEWSAGWGEEDLDADGRPGVTIAVDAPLCGGELQVASRTTTQLRLRPSDDGALSGEVVVSIDQRILDASNVCLRAGDASTTERHEGTMRLVPVPADARCGHWGPADWPARPR